MSLKTDAHEVKIFALVPIGCGPYRSNGLNDRITPGETNFQPQALAALKTKQMVIYFEARLEREAIDRGNIGKERKRRRRLGRQILSDSLDVLFRDDYSRFAFRFDHFGDGLRVPIPEFLNDWMFL